MRLYMIFSRGYKLIVQIWFWSNIWEFFFGMNHQFLILICNLIDVLIWNIYITIFDVSIRFYIKSVNMIFSLNIKVELYYIWDCIAEDGSKVNWNVRNIFWNKVLRLHVRINHADSHLFWFIGFFVVEFGRVRKKITLLLFVC